MAKTLPKIISIISALVLLFVINTRPLCVSAADTPDLTLIETELSASEVAELVAGEVAVGVILIIVGFIALTYVTLRNVDAPIQFSSEQSFFDKCRALGQYMLDHIDDNVKDVIYSVYQFVTAGNITSISSVPKLNLTTVGQFFAKIGAWLGGSFVNSVNTVTQGLLDQFTSVALPSFSSYSYTDTFATIFENTTSRSYYNTFGVYTGYRIGQFIYINSIQSPSNPAFVLSPYGLVLASVSDSGLTASGSMYLYYIDYTPYYGSWSDAPSLSSYTSTLYMDTSAWSFNQSQGFGVDSSYLISSLLSYGLDIYLAESVANTYSLSDVTLYVESTVDIPSSADTVTVPLSDELLLQIADVAAAAAAGTIATTKDYYDELIAGLALTITSALSGSNFTMPEGDYYIPSLDNIWKYVEYMFSTLGSWIIFAGKCIQCVTVGEGGLSWIFYGGFIFLICGGIVGKILLG